MLKEVADRLQSHVRASDTIALIGGDEFIVLSEVTDSRPPPSDIIEKLDEIIKEPMRNLNDLEIKASFGSAHYSTHGTTPTELMRHADRHMYIDKQRHKEKLAQSDNIIKLTS